MNLFAISPWQNTSYRGAGGPLFGNLPGISEEHVWLWHKISSRPALHNGGGFIINLKLLYRDTSCFITLTTFNVHRTLRCHQKENFTKVFSGGGFFKQCASEGEHNPLWSQHLCCGTSAPRHVTGAGGYFLWELSNQDGVYSLFIHRGFPLAWKGCRLIFNFILWNTSVKWVS